ncbi:hypothetical protein [Stenotrophomonas maltophilia]|uniref:hypothetical protein n=1 Tax=Stenotrophomonas maltophilia TaxID=40324 RepID=UPI0018D4963A|nr:hypothetical protein [Stenotrophomonas maltophilia]MBH1478408.1 hypothetical protein [Stenotrophomonas maltophilia]MBH1503751.1 hypothetical protein [Stenotrophomonas maltophilia]MDG2506777.1 hypothetical protein [Stenotrophomonas maltophilia]HDS1656575.1 hypothetical protein [Stenotrophomonas maltophilia]
MAVILYNLLMTFFLIPLTIRAYLSLKRGRLPLPHFQNNVVVNRVKLQKAIGIWSPTLFWVFHIAWLMWNWSIDAWIGVLATIAYMVSSAMLSGQIKAKQIGVIPEQAASGNDHA